MLLINLKKVMQKKGFSQAKLVKETGISQPIISNIYNIKRGATSEQLKLIVGTLKTTKKALIG